MDNTEIFGCFVSIEHEMNEILSTRKIVDEKGELFRSYIWNGKGINNKLVLLDRESYGQDLNLVLFQFYVNPSSCTTPYLKEIESYRKKEKAIGIPIIVTDENFFAKTEEERYTFLKVSIMHKMDVLEAVVKRRKLDTNMKLLKSDLEKVLVFP